ncbi:extracellular solute-binding protein [Promicromonospora sp. NPDC050249]|uniref:extracellular solute-binding protein n=1 Tax=Promicromonospora sp. NPDC050249 TaxID=3154743 RepID=UPI0033CB44C8
MRKSFARVGAATLALAMSTATLAACGPSGGSDSGEPTEITMLVLGDKPENGRLEAMLEELNPHLIEEANATLDFYYVEWADWQTQYNTQLLSGDDSIDLITTATDWLFAWENAEKGAFLPLSEEMLQEHAPRTWEQVEANGNWDKVTLDGEIFFIPEDNFTQWTNHGFFYRGDWAKEAGFEDGTITKFEDFTTYFEWVKENKKDAYPWDVAGANDHALTGYLQGHTDGQTLQQITAGNYWPFQTTEADPDTVTSWYMEGDELLEAAELAKEWNDIGVWREDALNYDGVTRELFYAGLSGADQHHAQTYIGAIVDNMNKKQPGSDPKFFYWGQENGNFFRDIPTHGAMAVNATSGNPEKALEVYDVLRNDEEAYKLLNFGIEGTDYVMTDEGKLDRPEGWDETTDALGSNFWGGRMDEFEPDRVTDAPNKQEIYDELDAAAKDYPYTTLIVNKDLIDPYLAAMGGVLSEYIPQLQYGKFDDPAAAIADMREELEAAGYNEARDAIQADLDAWAETQG